jgi:Cu(I)/Ag(I) efflux system membrane protein CusA/SilA
VPGTASAYAERLTGGYYLDIEPDRDALARLGITVGQLQDVISTALGGEVLTTTVEGRARFGVIVRYPRDSRSDPQAIAREVLVPIESEMGRPARMVPLGQVASIVLRQGAPVVRTENSLLSAYIYVDIRDRDIGSYVKDAQRAVREQVNFLPGMYVTWSGQFEYLERALDKLALVVPLTLAIIFVLLYLSLKSFGDTAIVMLSVPFSLVGGIWFLWALDYNVSVAVAVGFIALAGVAAETGVVMIVYLNNAWQEAKERALREGRRPTLGELHEAVVAGAVERVRPKVMTVVTTIAALVPIMWIDGTGAEVMRRIAAPMVGGMISSTVLTLAVIPAIYMLVKAREADAKPVSVKSAA